MNPIAAMAEGTLWKGFQRPIAFLVFCLVLFGIPLSMVWGLYGEMLEAKRRELIQEQREGLEALAAGVRPNQASLRGIAPDLVVRWRKAAMARDGGNAFRNYRRLLKRSFPGLIDIVLIDSQGRAVPGYSDPVLPERILGLLRTNALNSFATNQPVPDADRALLADALGPFMSARTHGLLSLVVPLSVRGKWTSMFLMEEVAGHLCLLLFRDSPDWAERIMSLQLRLLQADNPGLRAVGLDLRQSLESQARPLGRAASRLRALLRDPDAQTGAAVVQGDWVMMQKPLRQRYRAVLALPLSQADGGSLPGGAHGRRDLAGLLLGFFVLLSLIAWKRFFRDPQPFSSLRIKLGLLLLYLVVLPLLLLGLAAWKSLGEMRSVLEHRLWSKQRRALQDVEYRYRERLGSMENEIIRRVGRIGRFRPETFPQLVETVGHLKARYQPQMCDILGVDGKVIVHTGNAWDKTARQITTLLQAVAAGVCSDLNLGGGRNLTPREQLMTATGEMMGMNVGLMYSAVTRFLGELFSIQMDQAVNFAFLNPILDPAGRAQGMIVLGWDRGVLPKAYLSAVGPGLASGAGEIAVWFGEGILSPVMLAGMPAGREVVRRLSQIQAELIPVSWKTVEHDRTFLLTGAPAVFYENFLLIAVSSDERIRRELRPLAWRFGLIGLIFAGMGMLTARLLAGRFLEPIGRLTEGVRAIERRDFTHRIRINANDELGRLSGIFNGMMDGLKDLEIARVVQERFFPRASLSLGGWEAFGTCVCASRVGGDYIDYFPVGNDRIGLVIGDVSGHGVGAALVVAMAKALISRPDAVFEPGKNLEQLQKVFTTTLQRKKMMSCCIVLFEPATGILRSANAGHNLPFLIRADGRVEHLRPGGKPLGTKNKPFVEQEERLGEGDWVFLYTDGFIEAEARQPHGGDASIGYERVSAALPALRRNGARETEQALRDWHATLAAPVPQADDCTVMVLCHREKQGNEGGCQQDAGSARLQSRTTP